MEYNLKSFSTEKVKLSSHKPLKSVSTEKVKLSSHKPLDVASFNIPKEKYEDKRRVVTHKFI